MFNQYTIIIGLSFDLIIVFLLCELFGFFFTIICKKFNPCVEMIGQCASAFFFGVTGYDFVLNPMFSMISVSRGYRPGQVLI